MNRGFSTGPLAEPQALASEGANSGDVGGSMVGLPSLCLRKSRLQQRNWREEVPAQTETLVL